MSYQINKNMETKIYHLIYDHGDQTENFIIEALNEDQAIELTGLPEKDNKFIHIQEIVKTGKPNIIF